MTEANSEQLTIADSAALAAAIKERVQLATAAAKPPFDSGSRGPGVDGFALVVLGDLQPGVGSAFSATTNGGIGAVKEALLGAQVDGRGIVTYAAEIGAHGLGAAILNLCACLDSGVAADVSALTKRDEQADDVSVLLGDGGGCLLLAVPPAAVRAVEAGAGAEDVAWARIGTLGGDLVVITGDGIGSGGGEHTLMTF